MRRIIEPVWLDGKRSNKRTLQNIERFQSPEKIYDMITNSPVWKYHINKKLYEKRDRAFLAFLYLSGARVSEAIKLKKQQLDLSDPDFIVVRDFEISKRKKKTILKYGKPKIDIPLPREGRFAPFTQLILDYLLENPETLFGFGRQRAWQIVKYTTGKWCHYFRSQRISSLINSIRSSDATAKIVGIKNPQTIAHYYKGTWKQYREELKT